MPVSFGRARVVLPTATNWLPVHVTEIRFPVIPEVRGVHVTPSCEVRMVPSLPTAMSWLPVQVTNSKTAVEPEDRDAQVMPSGDVRTAPLSPTATS